MTRRTLKDLEIDKFKNYKAVVKTTDEDLALYDTLEISITNVSSTAVKISTPESSGFFFIEHIESGETVYLGPKGVTSSNGYPLLPNVKLEIKYFRKNNNNEIYAVTSTGTVKLYCVGVAKS